MGKVTFATGGNGGLVVWGVFVVGLHLRRESTRELSMGDGNVGLMKVGTGWKERGEKLVCGEFVG